MERQQIMFDVVEKVLNTDYRFEDKDSTRKFFMDLQQTFIDWNDKARNSPEFETQKAALLRKIDEAKA